MENGVFIVLEGVDKTGKETQSRLLVQHLKRIKRQVVLLHFPQYGQKSAGLVENYLEGKYGTAEEVGPYRASVFYAADRYDKSFAIREGLKKGKAVVADRYWASNLGHQGGMIKDPEERRKFIDWLYRLEFKIFSIPKPDITFFLKVSPEMAQSLGGEGRDILEKDPEHEKRAFQAYLEAAQMFPQEFSVIECLKNNQFLEAPIIHQKIWTEVENLILTDKN